MRGGIRAQNCLVPTGLGAARSLTALPDAAPARGVRALVLCVRGPEGGPPVARGLGGQATERDLEPCVELAGILPVLGDDRFADQDVHLAAPDPLGPLREQVLGPRDP